MNDNKSKNSFIPGNGLAVKVLGPRPKDIEYALRIWKRIMKDSNIIDKFKENMEYEKPTTKRRRLRLTAIRNHKRTQREQYD